MSNMREREETFERMFVRDEELKFKATVRRNKLLGLWAAEKLGRTGDQADAYAKEVVKADFEEAGDEDVFRKIRSDFDASGVTETDDAIRNKMVELLAEAIAQVKGE
ncbi:DUF1476 domain-containing protein [Chelativorans sp. AA-79]|uniref:DUF1476 domain-containing protein n=1 Tax=Chelativorans sp. AA-79 TaxID=3028735 RepID=UPI0023F89623|nr:DUF1476 domain-containing protein [Chelativorans sp. AA-79]WEX11654.1 DUF1476 domain-containing protein [Chelativorans sp. AA-79]